MHEKLYTFDRASVEMLRRIVHSEMRRVKTSLAHSVAMAATPLLRMHVGLTTEAIASGTVATPSIGTVALEWVDDSVGSSLTAIIDSTNTVEAYNLFGAIPISHRVLVAQEPSGAWWIVDAQIHTRYRGQLDGVLATTDASKTVDNLVLVSGMEWGITSLTAYNVCAWSAADNNAVYVEWVAEAGRWEMYQLKC